MLPFVEFEIVCPVTNVTVQYGAPFTFSCKVTGASAAVPSTAYTSRTECGASTISGGAAAASTARNPATWIEYCTPASVRSPSSSLFVGYELATGLLPRVLVTNISAQATRASTRAIGYRQLPLYGLPKNPVGNGTISVRLLSRYTAADTACAAAAVPSIPRATVYCVPPACAAVTRSTSASICR